ncbi:MAG TPA: CehA/McbA family metallohydrolase [Bryobacteraceae bacterium]|nr:CehA/McbA family metallohydrolase [Bryobacteraceae bacterium]
MSWRPFWGAAGLMAVSLAAGSLEPYSPPRARQCQAGGYQVLAADFHVHSFPLSWSTLSPFDTVLEARRQGLDAIAMAGHNNVWVAQWGRWFSRRIGGPIVLVSEEVHAPSYHMIAVGIERAVSWRQPAARAIDEIHRQGGIAIAAHPIADYWPGWDAEAMRRLDGAEVVHPVEFHDPEARLQLREFFARRKLTAIGSSDFHYSERMGMARTYVFVTERSERGVLEALRQGHTVVYDRDGQAFGDPDLIKLGVVPKLTAPPPSGLWNHVSLATGVLGLLMAAAGLRRANG